MQIFENSLSDVLNQLIVYLQKYDKSETYYKIFF